MTIRADVSHTIWAFTNCATFVTHSDVTGVARFDVSAILTKFRIASLTITHSLTAGAKNETAVFAFFDLRAKFAVPPTANFACFEAVTYVAARQSARIAINNLEITAGLT